MAGKTAKSGATTGSSPTSVTNKPKEISIFAKIYLIAYNVAQVFGWTYLLYQLIAFHTFDNATNKSLWQYLGFTVIVFQNAALLEIVHAAIGIVKSNVVLTTFQVLSRVIVVCGVLLATPNAIYSPGLPLALLAWSVTEIIRYGYYGFNLINFVPGVLVWLRYTTFIVLYPIGVTGELLCFYWAQSYARDNPIWSLEMPNANNVTFSYFYFLWIVMLLYIPLFPQLYLHMFAQRKKVLGSTTSSPRGGSTKTKTK